MKTIAILRHGEAVYGGDYDASRALTESGIINSRVAAKTLHDNFLAEGGLQAVFYSPFLRTQQTAEAVLAAFDDSLIIAEASNMLLGDNTPLNVCIWLETLPFDRILLVSHQPLVSCLVDWLVQGTDSFKLGGTNNYPFHPSSLAMLSADITAQGCANLLSFTHHPSR
jgi:phosphohistidine phosphatase